MTRFRSPRFTGPATLVALIAALGCQETFEAGNPTVADSLDVPPALPADLPELDGELRSDHLIEPDETRFLELFQLTFDGENANAIWSFNGDRLVLQRRSLEQGIDCDRIFVFDENGLHQISSGAGVTASAYFLPDDESVMYASTFARMSDCPPERGETTPWELHPEYEIYIQELASGRARPLAPSLGYDAEATISPVGNLVAFTSTRSGDPELWTCDLNGEQLTRITRLPGYDGEASFSHAGSRLVWRSTVFTPGKETEEQKAFAALLARGQVQPGAMELMTARIDGGQRQPLTALGGSNRAPNFTPDDEAVLFASNHHTGTDSRDLDLFLVPSEGGPHGPEQLERVTTYEGFDSFPMFHPSGEWLVFSSSRGAAAEGDVNLFVARWRTAD